MNLKSSWALMSKKVMKKTWNSFSSHDQLIHESIISLNHDLTRREMAFMQSQFKNERGKQTFLPHLDLNYGSLEPIASGLLPISYADLF